MRRHRVARVAHEPEHVAPAHPLAGRHAQAAGLEVRVEHVVPASDVQDDVVAVGLSERDVLGEAPRHLLGQAVDDRRDAAVGDGVGRVAIDGVAVQVELRAGVDAALRVELLPVDGEALGDDHAPVHRQGRPRVAGRVAAGVRRDVAGALERRPEAHHLALEDRGLPACGGEVTARRRGLRIAHVNLVDQARRRPRPRGQADVDEQQRLGAAGHRARRVAPSVRLKAPVNGLRPHGLHHPSAGGAHPHPAHDRVEGREVRELQLVDEVGAAVRPAEGDGRVLDLHEERGDLRVGRLPRGGRRRDAGAERRDRGQGDGGPPHVPLPRSPRDDLAILRREASREQGRGSEPLMTSDR